MCDEPAMSHIVYSLCSPRNAIVYILLRHDDMRRTWHTVSVNPDV